MKKKLIETCKTVLIVLLMLAVVVLSVMAMPQQDLIKTPWTAKLLRPFAGILGMAEAELTYTAPPAERAVTAASQPIAITVLTEDGRMTVQHDFAALDTAYEQLGSLLAQALDNTEAGTRISREDAMASLQQTSVAFCFPSQIPASLLSVWLNVQSPDSDGARWYIVSVEGDAVLLTLIGDTCTQMQTGLSAQSIAEALLNISPDGSYFAFQDETGRLQQINPLSLISGEQSIPGNGTWSNPCEARWISSLASSLGFNPYGGARYVDNDGTTSFTDQSYALRVTSTGRLTLEILQADADFQSASGEACDQIEAARRILQQLSGDVLGEARLLLADYESKENGAVCTFSYYLSGIAVSDGSEEAATVIFEGNYARKVVMNVRTYHVTSDVPTLLPVAQAASIASQDQPLRLLYAEQPEGLLTLNWEKD